MSSKIVGWERHLPDRGETFPQERARCGPLSLVTQILDVLLHNTLRHGRGTVTLTAREISHTTAIDIADEGSIAIKSATVFERGTSGGSGQGIGLAMPDR